MEYLLAMSLSGTTAACVCILCRFVLKGKIPARLQYILLKISVLYYLIPLPFLRDWYWKILMEVTGIRLPLDRAVSTCRKHSYFIAYADDSVFINNYMKVQIAAAAVWILISVLFFLVELFNYIGKRKLVMDCIKNLGMEPEKTEIERGLGRCRFSQKITVYYELHDIANMTFGLFKPVILCNAEAKSAEAEIILQHEITHIKRFDVFWKTLLRLAVIIHWWNPVVWFLKYDFERVCECSCDEIVLAGKTKDERKAYMRLIINESVNSKRKEVRCIRLSVGLKGEMEKLKERMENAMNMRKWNKAAALLMAVLVILVNSLTVFAYPKVETMGGVWESDEEAESFINADLCVFMPESASEEEKKESIGYKEGYVEIRYEKQFIDAEGNIYQVDDMGTTVYVSCSHEYVSGTYTKHEKNSNGGCTVTQYSAQRCTKCGYIVKGDRLYVVNFDVCPH